MRIAVTNRKDPMSDDEIMKIAPSVFAMEKHTSRSQRYTYIPTIEVLNGLRKEGFQVYNAAQGRTRIEGKQLFTKHMLRLRNHNNAIVGDCVNEIILLNSHDGTSAYKMMAGCYRFVCANGMVSGDTTHDLKFRHSGNIVDEVIEGAFRVLDDFERVTEERQKMEAITLSPQEQSIFAHAALQLKYDPREDVQDVEIIEGPKIDANRLNYARRIEDRGNDGWKTFNRVQENMIKGGVQGTSASGRRMTTRPVTGIDQNIKLNRALWVLMSEMEKLKGSA